MLMKWDQIGERLYETGTKKGVCYKQESDGSYPKGEAWNGLTGVTESPSGAEVTALYANDAKYVNLMSSEDFGATITAYTYPDSFSECNGQKEIAPGVFAGQQKRAAFGMSYQTAIGNDVDQDDYGYKLHMIYGALASPSEKAYKSKNNSPEGIEFSWTISTTPVDVPGGNPTAHLELDSTKVDAKKLADLEKVLYGTDPELLSAQPDDWATNYKDYLTKEGNKYVAVSGVSAPDWAEKKYYTPGTDGRLPLPGEIAEIMKTA